MLATSTPHKFDYVHYGFVPQLLLNCTLNWNQIFFSPSSSCAGKKGAQIGHDILTHLHFKLLYPRLDINVSRMMNHLLKSPFCVHPKTHRICVPIDPAHLDKFDPTEVPSLEDALRDLDATAASSAKQVHEQRMACVFVRPLPRSTLRA